MKSLNLVLLLVLGLHAAEAVNTGDDGGYALTFQGGTTTIGTRKATWDLTHTGFNALDGEMSLSFRARFLHWVNEQTFLFTIGHPLERNFLHMASNRVIHNGGILPLVDVDTEVWAHYTLTIKRVDEYGGRLHLYRDGNLVYNISTTITTLNNAGTYLTIGGNPYTYFDSEMLMKRDHLGTFQIDSFILHNRIISQSEVVELYNKNPDPEVASVNDPSIVLYYTFDADCGNYSKSLPQNTTAGLLDPTCYVTGQPVAKNYGVAGSDYDMLLDGIDNSLGFGKYWIAVGEDSDPIPIAPATPSRATYSAGLTLNTPHVYHVASGKTIQINLVAKYENGTDVSPTNLEIINSPSIGTFTTVSPDVVNFTAPDALPDTVVWSTTPLILTYKVTNEDALQQVHIWPLERPKANIPFSRVKTLEDQPKKTHWIFRIGVDPLGESLKAFVSQMPQKGTLLQFDNTPITHVGEYVTSKSGTVIYVPGTNGVGTSYDTYGMTYIQGEVDDPLISEQVLQIIDVVPLNDLPEVSVDTTIELNEDNTLGVLVPLGASDVENEPFATVITKLPTQGKLYLTDDDTLTGKRTLIGRPFEHYDMGKLFTQYADEVAAVSSFWGSPLDIGYHAMGILGRPNCHTLGECQDERFTDGSDPIVDDIIVFDLNWDNPSREMTTAPAKVLQVTETPTGDKLYQVRVSLVQREVSSGVYERCLPLGPSFPSECDSGSISAKLNAAGEHIVSNVPRSALHSVNAGVWCPLMRNFGETVQRVGGQSAAAFGDQYDFNNNQKDTWFNADPPFTEFIELKFKQQVFITAVVIGSPRGTGAVVSIRAKHPVTGEYTQIYNELPRAALAKKIAEESAYHQWELPLCRPPFATDHLRIELDTETITDWNYVDYVELLGALDDESVQPGFLRWPNKNIVYVPNKDAHGADSFEFKASDCMGTRLRDSKDTSRVNLQITPSNDAPTIKVIGTEPVIRILPSTRVTSMLPNYSLQVKVGDVDGDELTVSVKKSPNNALVTTFLENPTLTFQKLPGESATMSDFTLRFSPTNCTTVHTKSEDLILEVRDTTGLTTELTISVILECSQLPKQYERWVVDESSEVLIMSWTVIGTCVSIMWIAFNIGFRKRQVVRLSSPVINTVLLFGCAIIHLALPYFGANSVGITACDELFMLASSQDLNTTVDFSCTDPLTRECCVNAGTHVCTIKFWLITIGVVIAFSALYAKTHRIMVLIASNTMKKVVITNGKLVSYVAVALFVASAFMAFWTLMYPLQVEYTVAEEILVQSEQKVTVLMKESCAGDNYDPFVLLLGASFAASLIFGVSLAYKVRNVNLRGANDAKSIMYSMYNLAIFVTINFVVSQVVENPVNNFLFVFTICYLAVIVFEFSLFVPRVLDLCSGKTSFSSVSGTSKSKATNSQVAPSRASASGND